MCSDAGQSRVLGASTTSGWHVLGQVMRRFLLIGPDVLPSKVFWVDFIDPGRFGGTCYRAAN